MQRDRKSEKSKKKLSLLAVRKTLERREVSKYKYMTEARARGRRKTAAAIQRGEKNKGNDAIGT